MTLRELADQWASISDSVESAQRHLDEARKRAAAAEANLAERRTMLEKCEVPLKALVGVNRVSQRAILLSDGKRVLIVSSICGIAPAVEALPLEPEAEA